MTRVKFWGHAFCSLSQEEQTLAVDPYHPQGPIPESFFPTLILVTHGHGDHLGEAVNLSRRTGSPILGTFELAEYLRERGASAIDGNFGGKIAFPFGWVKIVPAVHTSTSPEGRPLGSPAGFLVKFFDHIFYHAGDTALFSDMALLKNEGKIFCAFIPIGGHYTMGPEEALEAVKIIEPEIVIPIHYNTFPLIQQDPSIFKEKVEQGTGSKVLILEPGQEVEI
ncbi:MAG: metal-dependent hydrolase [Caldiserica bacterium]|jgi:L-ascorbate metabolism protein UlaG (beta-lactamase superfamily)|nr:metal-dependent hydrolase [Caldisericota bacterium]